MSNIPKIHHQHLIIFTRYPEPGRTKTRLIPKLGAEGAANLQREMTERTLFQVRELQQQISVSVEIRFTGGNLQLMRNWLGDNWIYQPQGGGDLGEKMARSLNSAFHLNCHHSGQQRNHKTVIIGTDCPGLNTHILQTAFQSLDDSEVVIGPATDGGYYLIGACRVYPELFANIAWGTADVLQQTSHVLESLHLSCSFLNPLTDIDRPEDLFIWEKIIWEKGNRPQVIGD